MKKILATVLFTLITLGMFAQAPDPKAVPLAKDGTPKLTDAQKSTVFKMVLQFQTLNQSVQQFQKSFQDTTADFCKSSDGKKYVLSLGDVMKNEEPSCVEVKPPVVTPVPANTPEKAPEKK